MEVFRARMASGTQGKEGHDNWQGNIGRDHVDLFLSVSAGWEVGNPDDRAFSLHDSRCPDLLLRA